MIQKLTNVLLQIARKRAGELTISEVKEIFKREQEMNAEAYRIVNFEIPELIKYLDYLYPPQQLIGFRKFTGRLYD